MALLENLRNRSGANRVAAFANRKPQPLLERHRGDERYFAAHVVARHHHLDALRQLHVSSYVRRAEVELRTIAREERRMTPAFFLCQNVSLSLELRVRGDRARLADYLPALHVVLFCSAQQQANVVARNAFIEELLEHLDAGNNFLLRRTEAADFDLFASLYLAAFDSSCNDSIAARDRE